MPLAHLLCSTCHRNLALQSELRLCEWRIRVMWALAVQTLVTLIFTTTRLAVVATEETGAACFHKVRNVTARCRPLPACASGMLELKKNIYPQLCGFPRGGSVPEVCCWEPSGQGGGGGGVALSSQGDQGGQGGQHPSMSCSEYLQAQEAQFITLSAPGAAGRRKPGRVARRKCKEYVQYVCFEGPSAALMVQATDVQDRCHYKVELISGGKQAEPMEFPHMALLGYGERQRIDFGCGGSLISPNFILTAAHCKDSRPLGNAVRWALLGAQSRHQLAEVTSGSSSSGDQLPQLIQVRQVIVHPDYVVSLRYNDVALLRLERDASLGDAVRPACLHTEHDGAVAGANAIATGWGATGDAEDLSEALLKVTLPITSFEQCRRVMNQTADRKLNRGIISSQLCAGGTSHKDTCPGDSGGPLQLPTNNDPYCMYRIVGVVSFGPPCGIGLPGVYSRVSHFVSWIESVVWPGET